MTNNGERKRDAETTAKETRDAGNREAARFLFWAWKSAATMGTPQPGRAGGGADNGQTIPQEEPGKRKKDHALFPEPDRARVAGIGDGPAMQYEPDREEGGRRPARFPD